MKQYPVLAFLALFMLLMSCEKTEEQETICLPTNISITLFQGTSSSKIIADFYYIPDTEQLDHITWSDKQTYYFTYDEEGRIESVSILKVDPKLQVERWFVYDGSLVERVDLVERNLHYTTLEPMDSIYTGYIEFEYESGHIVEESEYAISEGGYREDYVRKVSYEYDSRGNLLSTLETNPRSGESEQITMSYDQSKHPYHALQYYFSGESYINNLLTKTEEANDFEYTYSVTLNEYEYPETIYEKLGSAYTRIINYAYTIK